MKNKKHCISKKGKESYCYISILKKDESIVNFFLGVFFDFLRIYICEMSKKKIRNRGREIITFQRKSRHRSVA